jgi:hypothetical protein
LRSERVEEAKGMLRRCAPQHDKKDRRVLAALLSMTKSSGIFAELLGMTKKLSVFSLRSSA